jgi:hypothetical protein
MYKDEGESDVEKINLFERTFCCLGVYPYPVCAAGGGGHYGECFIKSVINQATLGVLWPDSINKVCSPYDASGGMYYHAICGEGTGNGVNVDMSKFTKTMYEFFKRMTNSDINAMGIMPTVERVNRMMPWNIARIVASKQDKNNKGEFIGPSGVDEVVSYDNSVISLGLVFNKEQMEFYGTMHNFATIPPVPPVYAGNHGHAVTSYLLETWNTSWYFYNDKFANRKVTILVRKKYNPNSGYPFLKNFFNIEWPEIMATASACCYNPSDKGNGFIKCPESGKSERIWEVIEAYNNGKSKGGWFAHLVPTTGSFH